MSHFLIAPLYLFNYSSLLELFSSASDMSCWTGLDPVINVIANIWTLGITKSFLNLHYGRVYNKLCPQSSCTILPHE